LTLVDIDFNSEPVKINVRAETSKSGEDRETYISKEASDALRDYLSRYFGWKEDSTNKKIQSLRIFGRTNKIKEGDSFRLPTPQEQLSDSINLQKALIRAINKVPDLNKIGRNGRLKFILSCIEKNKPLYKTDIRFLESMTDRLEWRIERLKGNTDAKQKEKHSRTLISNKELDEIIDRKDAIQRCIRL